MSRCRPSARASCSHGLTRRSMPGRGRSTLSVCLDLRAPPIAPGRRPRCARPPPRCRTWRPRADCALAQARRRRRPQTRRRRRGRRASRQERGNTVCTTDPPSGAADERSSAAIRRSPRHTLHAARDANSAWQLSHSCSEITAALKRSGAVWVQLDGEMSPSAVARRQRHVAQQRAVSSRRHVLALLPAAHESLWRETDEVGVPLPGDGVSRATGPSAGSWCRA